jgi:hypothetical protein
MKKKMTFKEQLVKLRACNEAVAWVGDKTLKQAWRTCHNPYWMLWILTKTDLDLIDPLCTIAKRVLHLIPEKHKQHKLVCINAINAAQRRAPKDELEAVAAAAHESPHRRDAGDESYFACYPASFAANYACIAIYRKNLSRAKWTSSNAANYGLCYLFLRYYEDSLAAATRVVDYAIRAHYFSEPMDREQKKQCNILRKYFTINQVQKAFNELVTFPFIVGPRL